MREIGSGEAGRLGECLKALAEHHNEVSVFFKGQYPKKPFDETLASFEKEIASGRSKIAVIENDDKILGFCKVDMIGEEGKLDYLIVLKEARGKGYGNELIEWALDIFRKNGVKKIEVKVADGNNAIDFYEKYGFRPNAHILTITDKK